MGITIEDERTWAVVDLIEIAVWIELEPEVELWNCLERERIFERRLDLDISLSRCDSVMRRTRNIVNCELVLERSNNLADVTNKAPINREGTIRKCCCEAIYATEDVLKCLGDFAAAGHRGANV